MVIIVTLSDNRRYLLDVGYGGSGPTHPLPMEPEFISRGIEHQEYRLVHQNIPQNTNPTQNLWIYQNRNTPQDKWNPSYCFTSLEFLPQDFEIMSFWTSQSRKSWCTYRLIVLKMLVKDDKIIGTLSLVGGELKKKVAERSEVLVSCRTEGERIEVLRKWFGVVLSDEEKKGIRGLASALLED